MTGSIQLIREFCDILISPEKATRTRIVIFSNFHLFEDKMAVVLNVGASDGSLILY